jgi:hypothetical protein
MPPGLQQSVDGVYHPDFLTDADIRRQPFQVVSLAIVSWIPMSAVLGKPVERRLPPIVGDQQGLLIDTDPIAGVLVPLPGTAAIGSRRAGVKNDHRGATLGVELLGVADKRLMQVPGQNQVHPGAGEDIHGFPSIGRHGLSIEPGGLNHMMVGHHHLEHAGWRGIQQVSHLGKTLRGEATVLERTSVSGVDPDHQDLIVLENRLELGSEVLGVGAERPTESLPEPVQGDIVVSRNHQRGHGEAVDECPGFLKLVGFGPLRQVPRDHHEIGLSLIDELQHPA